MGHIFLLGAFHVDGNLHFPPPSPPLRQEWVKDASQRAQAAVADAQQRGQVRGCGADVGVRLPSGKHTKNDGKSSFLMGQLTINGHFQ